MIISESFRTFVARLSLNIRNMEKIITPTNLDVPKEGTIGYVHVEDVNYDGPELEPRLYKMGEYEFEGLTEGITEGIMNHGEL